jgi:hypothetical protein
MPDQVNPQVTDAVTQTNVKVVAEAPAQAIASLYQVMTSATGMASQNAVSSQQALNHLLPLIVGKAVKIIDSA